MRAHLIKNGLVVNTIEVESIAMFPDLDLIDADKTGGMIGDTWTGDTLIPQAPAPARLDILAQIIALEGQITDRMRREALIGRQTINTKTGNTAKQDIAAIDDQIATLRAQL